MTTPKRDFDIEWLERMRVDNAAVLRNKSLSVAHRVALLWEKKAFVRVIRRLGGKPARLAPVKMSNGGDVSA